MRFFAAGPLLFFKMVRSRWEAIKFAKRYISITSKDTDAVFHTWKSLLYYIDEPWFKKVERNFDFTMGAYDGKEVFESIGIFMLSLLSKHINKNHLRLYRDDGLKNTICLAAEKLKKNFFSKII